MACEFMWVLTQEISSGRSQGMSVTNSSTLSVYTHDVCRSSETISVIKVARYAFAFESERFLDMAKGGKRGGGPMSGHLQREPTQRTPGQTAAVAGHQRPTPERNN